MGGRAVRSAVKLLSNSGWGKGPAFDPERAVRSLTHSPRPVQQHRAGVVRDDKNLAVHSHYHVLPVQDMHQYTSTIVTKQRKPKPYQTSPYQHDSNETTKTKIVTKR